MSLNVLSRLVLVVFVVMFGIGSFASLGQSQGESAVSPDNPKVTVIGYPADLPQQIKSDLPTGYSWQRPEDFQRKDTIASDEKDPTIIFQIDPGNPNIDMKAQLEYARNKGKKEVIFLQPKEIDRSIEQVPLTAKDILGKVKWLDQFSISLDETILNFITTPAYAHSVQGTGCGGATLPAGTCNTATFTDDDLGDGKTPGVDVCLAHNGFACHLNSVFDHIKKNYAVSSTVSCNHTSSNGSPCPWVDCMKAHNGSSFIKAPVDLTVNLYYNYSDFVNNGILGCRSSNLCGCAHQPSFTTPRKSSGLLIELMGQNSCSWMELFKHELAHTYGYSHGNFNSNYENSKHCKNNHNIH